MKRAEISEKFAYARAARKCFEEICLDMYGPARLSARGHLGGSRGGAEPLRATTPCYFVSRIPRYRALSVAHAGGAHEDRLANYLPPVVSHRWLKVSTHSTRMHPSLRGSSRSRRYTSGESDWESLDWTFWTRQRMILSDHGVMLR